MELKDFDSSLEELSKLDTIDMGKVYATTPWQSPSVLSAPLTDEDGFSVMPGSDDMNYANFQSMQAMCWAKFNADPFVYTNVTDTIGRLTGYGFDTSSPENKIHDAITETWTDPRNDLILNFSKYIARCEIQGELFLNLTVHTTGFVEVDFISPTTIKGFADNSGIMTHPKKKTMPLMYRIEDSNNRTSYIPSINLALYPDLWKHVKADKTIKIERIVGKSTSKEHKKLGGYKSFIISYDRGFVTKRNIGRVKTVIEWLEHYTNLKKWEIDHKKSSGSYLWSVEMEDKQTLRMWLSLSDDEKAKTGLTAKKTPGGTLILPPGMKLACHNPKLSSISNQDDDILRLISSGLNTPEDVMTGSSSGTTYSGAKLSRGPLADRIMDSIADLQKFLIYRFWRNIFFLKSSVSSFQNEYKVEEAVKFDDNGEPVYKKVKKQAYQLVEIDFPISEISDVEGRSKAYLGVKHGPVTEQLGIPYSDVAKKLGFQSYHRKRLLTATEKKMYPELKTSAEIEASMEVGAEGNSEPKTVKPVVAPKPKPVVTK